MDKNFIVNQIACLIESHYLWSEMDKHLSAFGGNLWDSKYAEAYNYHEELVYELIIEHRGFPTLNQYEFESFCEDIYNLANYGETKIYNMNNEVVAVLTSAEDLYEWMIQISENYIPKEKDLN